MSDQKVYFFTGSSYVRFDFVDNKIDVAQPPYPRNLPGGWINLPFTKVDAAVNWGNGKVYFFSGPQYARSTLANNNRMDPTYPKDTAANWPGLTFPAIDAAVNLGNGKAYLFAGDEYVSWDIAGDHIDGPPRKIGPDWPGLFTSGIDAALNGGNGKAYFFKGTEYARFDIASHRVDDGYPIAVSAGWAGLTGPFDAAIERFVAPATPVRCTPVFDPAYWNDGADPVKTRNPRSVQKTNNCYNYATDVPNRTYAQPGRGAGGAVPVPLADCTGASTGATSDGLTAVAGPGPCTGCAHVVALVLWPGRDYHWYRLDSSGTWSHKLATSPATDRDHAGAIITDPRTANRGRYTVFCGFFCVAHDRPPLKLPVHLEGLIVP